GKEILIQGEERLNGHDFARGVLDEEVAVLEPFFECVLDQLVIAVMLSYIGESLGPMAAIRHLCTRGNLNPMGSRQAELRPGLGAEPSLQSQRLPIERLCIDQPVEHCLRKCRIFGKITFPSQSPSGGSRSAFAYNAQ